MVTKSLNHRTPAAGSRLSQGLRLALRALQIIIAFTVAGLYGVDINNGSRKYDGRWIYAEVVVGFSVVTAVVYMLPILRAHRFWMWDAVLFIFWTALFGIFGDMYIGHVHAGRMYSAVWVNLVGMLLWLASTLLGLWMSWQEKHSRSMFTGRAWVV